MSTRETYLLRDGAILTITHRSDDVWYWGDDGKRHSGGAEYYLEFSNGTVGTQVSKFHTVEEVLPEILESHGYDAINAVATKLFGNSKEKYVLTYTDGYILESTVFETHEQAFEAMKKAWEEGCENFEYGEESYIDDYSALAVIPGMERKLWAITKVVF